MRAVFTSKIDKKELVGRVSKRIPKGTGTVEEIVDATLEEIYEALKQEECVSLRKFGTFYVRLERDSWVFKFNPSQRLRKLFGWSSPYNDKPGGKVLHRSSKKTQNRANTATFRIAAQSLSRSQSVLGAFYRRMRAKHGPAKANKATAHKLARIFYHLLKHQEAYVDPVESHYEQQYRERVIRNLKRRAARLGMEPVPTSDQAPVVS